MKRPLLAVLDVAAYSCAVCWSSVAWETALVFRIDLEGSKKFFGFKKQCLIDFIQLISDMCRIGLSIAGPQHYLY